MFGPARNHSKKFPKYTQTSFNGVMNYIYCSQNVYQSQNQVICLVSRHTNMIGLHILTHMDRTSSHFSSLQVKQMNRIWRKKLQSNTVTHDHS